MSATTTTTTTTTNNNNNEDDLLQLTKSSSNVTSEIQITKESDLRRLDRKIWIVTTAALPWRTGTSVNPLARALYMTRNRPKHSVTLVVPFLEDPKEQAQVFGKTTSFSTLQEQEEWIRNYCRERVNCAEEAENLRFLFYAATYNKSFGSIFSTVDICALIPNEEADVCILEEPEHLNWMRVVDEPEEGEEEGDDPVDEEEQQRLRDIRELGWAVKFNHVVGIIHTNYDAYVRRYGMGAAFLAASALHALSSMVTRAYCHRVIRLSDTLPVLDKPKEITSNVHGVRVEFLQSPQPSEEENTEDLCPIYFIGKLIWAKGFDNLLDIQELYKKQKGEYFPIDVYGSGPDEKSIRRAFFGRKGLLESDNPKAPPSRENTPDRAAAKVFQVDSSLREKLYEEALAAKSKNEIEVVYDESVTANSEGSSSEDDEGERELPNPFIILRDISGGVVETSKSATAASAKIGGDVLNYGINSAFSQEGNDNSDDSDKLSEASESQTNGEETSEKKSWLKKNPLKFDPPKSRFELRRHKIPARFLGMKDHAVLRDLTRHKIFFNPSESEVLCTTSAEALAMGKFVILPRHPSNTFFLQFENCLAYSSKKECVEHLIWAMENDPKPLSEQEHFQLTWEGANERLYDASAVTVADVKEWKESGRAKGDLDAAKLHFETVKRGRDVHSFLHR
eukprot:Nitzschia sp. Nitz4//scaffold370_size15137//7469//9583//NITZ4_008895-RA/size15137-processed-gene-0.23-mRNA-1//-1//CDS//3329549574//3537//frame0